MSRCHLHHFFFTEKNSSVREIEENLLYFELQGVLYGLIGNLFYTDNTFNIYSTQETNF